jgi:hypothetical protein
VPNQVVVLHGWSDTSQSFHALGDFLRASGRVTVPLWLGDYISLDDDVRIPDVAKQLHNILQERMGNGTLYTPFDMIVHSTGGLVAREWLTTYYGTVGEPPPVRHLLMLAPANYGSKLASMGQSMLGRLVKGWNNWFHTGKEMLNALELGSPYQWNLTQRDVLLPPGTGATPGMYGYGRIWPFVIVGTHPYSDALRQIVNENGSDGTVRVPGANLNTLGMTLDFTVPGPTPQATAWGNRFAGTFPLAVLPNRTHGSIIDPLGGDIASETPLQKQQFQNLILQALNCATQAEYDAMAAEWWQISEQTVDPGDPLRHQYLQLNVEVFDDEGNPVNDYFLEFSGPSNDPSDDSTVYFHRSVLEDVHTNGQAATLRCLYADRTGLLDGFYPKIQPPAERILTLSLSANPPGKNVRYFSNTKVGATGEFKLHDLVLTEDRWLKRNTTHFLRIVIPRMPLSQVFNVSSYPLAG